MGLALIKGAGYLIRVVGLKCVAVLGESCDSVRGSDKIWAKFGFKWGTHFRCWSPVFTLSASARLVAPSARMSLSDKLP